VGGVVSLITVRDWVMTLAARSQHVEGPGSRLGLVARLVINLDRHQVLSLGQGDAQRLDAQAGLRVGQSSGDGQPGRNHLTHRSH
jgi:hypothetical protein